MKRFLPALLLLILSFPSAADPWMGFQFGVNRVSGNPGSFGESVEGSGFKDSNWTIGLSAGYELNPYTGLVIGIIEHDLERAWSTLTGSTLRGRSTFAGAEMIIPLGVHVALVGGTGIHRWDATVRRNYGGEKSDTGTDMYYSGAIRLFPHERGSADLQMTRYVINDLDVDAFTVSFRVRFGGKP